MSSVKCMQCGLVNWTSAEICKRCGVELGSVGPHTSTQWQPDAGFDVNSQEAPGASQDELEMACPVQPFDGVGAAVNSTFEVFRDNFWLITKIILVLFAPYEIAKALKFRGAEHDWQLMAGIALLGMVCKVLVSPALIYALYTSLQTGVAPSMSESFRWGLSRMGRILLVTILSSLLVLLGMVCLIVPGIILTLAFSVILPIATLEEGNAVDVLKRSYHMTDGYKGRIFGASMVVSLLAAVCSVPVGLVAGTLHATVNFWPFDAIFSMMTDVINELSTVMSLVIYLGILMCASRPAEYAENAVVNPA